MEDKIDLNQIAADEQDKSAQGEPKLQQEWTQDFATTGGDKGGGGGDATIAETPSF